MSMSEYIRKCLMGYWADGYDPVNHCICEYDTQYHRFPYQRRKDNKRQCEIVQHFQSIGRPLSGFYRVKVYDYNRIDNVLIGQERKEEV